MQVHTIAAIHAYGMLILGGWRLYSWKGGFGLQAVLFAVVILVMNQGLSHGTTPGKRVTLLMTVASFGLVKPLLHDIQYKDDVGAMIWATCLVLALISFVAQVRSLLK